MKKYFKFSVLPLLAALLPFTVPVSLHAAGKADPVAVEQAAARQALGALQMLFAGLAQGNQTQISQLIEPEMIGYSRVLEGTYEASLSHKQLRVTLSDTRTQVAQDTVTINTRWEKRYVVLLPSRMPVRKSGNAVFVMHKSNGLWRLSALSGDNPFTQN